MNNYSVRYAWDNYDRHLQHKTDSVYHLILLQSRITSKCFNEHLYIEIEYDS